MHWKRCLPSAHMPFTNVFGKTTKQTHSNDMTSNSVSNQQFSKEAQPIRSLKIEQNSLVDLLLCEIQCKDHFGLIRNWKKPWMARKDSEWRCRNRWTHFSFTKNEMCQLDERWRKIATNRKSQHTRAKIHDQRVTKVDSYLKRKQQG